MLLDEVVVVPVEWAGEEAQTAKVQFDWHPGVWTGEEAQGGEEAWTENLQSHHHPVK